MLSVRPVLLFSEYHTGKLTFINRKLIQTQEGVYLLISTPAANVIHRCCVISSNGKHRGTVGRGTVHCTQTQL